MTVDKKKVNKAVAEWMSRPQFTHAMPSSILDDVCSEGLNDLELLAVYQTIEEKLNVMLRSYQLEISTLY